MKFDSKTFNPEVFGRYVERVPKLRKNELLKSGAVVTKPRNIKIGDTDDTFKVLGVNSSEEAQMVQAKQIQADTSQDLALASILYESARSSSGLPLLSLYSPASI